MAASKLQIEYRSIGDLIPYARNSRTHSDEQVAQIAASIREFGFTNPVLVDDAGGIIAGHGRVMAARKLGMDSVPVIELGYLTEAQRRAYVIADNKLALNAGWNEELLAIELADLEGVGFDLSLLGFSDEELARAGMAGKQGLTDPDDAPEAPQEPISKLGDVYQLGPHRLIVGDATDVCALERVLEGALVDIVWTDPPYNVAYEGRAGAIKNDDLSASDFYELLFSAFSAAFGWMKPGAAIYVAHSEKETLSFYGAFKAAGFKQHGCVIWRKDALVLGRMDYQPIHEPILYGWKPGSKHRWYGGRKQTTVVELGEGSPFVQMEDGRYQITIGDQVMIVDAGAGVEYVVPSMLRVPKPRRSLEHPTMKPVELIERMLRHNARPGDIVLDPFGGSGSTLIAADRLGMCARLVELDPRYADVIVARWEAWTGRKAELTNHDGG